MSDESTTRRPKAVAENDLEAMSDTLQTRFVLGKAAKILELMRSVGTSPQALGEFERYWPHINKAWARACTTSHDSLRLLSIEFLRIVTPVLVVSGEREVLQERVAAALETAERMEDPQARAVAQYFAAVSAMQFRDYETALPLLECVRDSIDEDHIDPTPMDVLTALGATYVALGREDDASRTFEELSKSVLLRSLTFPMTSANMDRLHAESINRMFSGTGLVALLARPPRTLNPASGPHGGATFFRFERKQNNE